MQISLSGLILVFWMLIRSLVVAIGEYDKEAQNHEKLVTDLFQDYNPLVRPVENVNDSIHIEFSLQLSQIINLDEKNQVMKTNVWLQLYWNDTQLMWEHWDKSLYGTIKSIRIRPEWVWTPDIVLFNNADGNYEVTYKSNCVIYSSGLVTWIPPAIYQSACSIDVLYFPFDQQICYMKFGSWTFQGDQLSYEYYEGRKQLDLTDYLKSGTWDLIDGPGSIVNVTEDNQVKKMFIFKFVLRRKTLFYTINLIIPCVLISFVSVCVFALPADAGEKITLCISILLALVVFLLLVSKILPPSLKIPLIAKYLLFTFIMNIIAILSTVIIINRNYRTPRTHRMPNWVRKLFLYYIPKFLFMERPNHNSRWKKKELSPPPSYQNTPETRRVPLNMTSDLLELTEIHHPHCKLNPPHDRRKGVSEERDESFTMTPELYRATEAVRFIYKHLKTEEDYETVLDDWKYVARVIDRMMLYIFLLVTFGGTVGILINAPHILEYVDQDEILERLRKMNN